MDEFSLSTLGIALAVLLVCLGLLLDRRDGDDGGQPLPPEAPRAARQPGRQARARRCSAQTDRLLGVILFGNNLINAGAATLAGVITVRLLGEGELALAASTVVVTFLILVFSEITPKVIGATHADRIAPLVAYVLTPLLRGAARRSSGSSTCSCRACSKLLRVKPAPDGGTQLTQEELRSLVLEGSQYFRGKHKTMLANLMDLEAITVDDVMTPRNRIHALDLAEKPALLRQQLATSYHSRVPVYEESLDNLVGVLPLKSVVQPAAVVRRARPPTRLRPLLRPPYFIPAGTPLLTQLTQFQNDRQRLGLVVDEYGELQGLVTIEDIVEEIIGEFTTQAPGGAEIFRREPDGSVVVSGMAHAAHAQSPARHPVSRWTARRRSTASSSSIWATFPDAGLSFRLEGQLIEILQTQDRAVKVVKLLPPVGTGRRAFTNPGRAGIIDRLSFMRME